MTMTTGIPACLAFANGAATAVASCTATAIRLGRLEIAWLSFCCSTAESKLFDSTETLTPFSLSALVKLRLYAAMKGSAGAPSTRIADLPFAEPVVVDPAVEETIDESLDDAEPAAIVKHTTAKTADHKVRLDRPVSRFRK